MTRTNHPNLGRIDRLKERIQMESLLEKIGVDVSWKQGSFSTWISINCPFHDDNSPSARYSNQLGRFQCFGCSVGGSIVDVAMAHLRTEDIYEALEWLETEYPASAEEPKDEPPFVW